MWYLQAKTIYCVLFLRFVINMKIKCTEVFITLLEDKLQPFQHFTRFHKNDILNKSFWVY